MEMREGRGLLEEGERSNGWETTNKQAGEARGMRGAGDGEDRRGCGQRGEAGGKAVGERRARACRLRPRLPGSQAPPACTPLRRRLASGSGLSPGAWAWGLLGLRKGRL